MLKVYYDTKVFVHCPAGVVTGGVELLHQLVHVLKNNQVDAYIVYYGKSDHTIPDEYRKYNISTADIVENTERNIEVIPEVNFNFTNIHSLTQKFLWWLSIDHFFMCSVPFLALTDIFKYSFILGCKAFAKRCINLLMNTSSDSFFNTISIKQLRNLNAVHGYQSEYAQNFLQNHKFTQLVSLKDYINTEHLEPFSTKHRNNTVLYNPKKGINFTKKIMSAAPHLSWVPIENLTRNQLVKLMKSSKLYIDFGYHPGKDRLPRECAMNGCCIITGRRGSAAFFEDVAISDKYKFYDKNRNIDAIVNRISETLSNYEVAVDEFAHYRRAIMSEKCEFERDVIRIFSISE